MKLGAQLYTVRDYLKNEDDIFQSLKKIKAIGYDIIQLSGLGEFRPEWLKDKADEIGLKICVTHNSLERITHDTDNLIKEHILYDAKYIGLGFHDLSTIEKCDDFIKNISVATEKFFDAGLKFVYHNHAVEFNRLKKKQFIIDYIAENTDKEKFGFLVDLYWVQFGGYSPVKFLEKYSDRIDVVHFKDLKIENLVQPTFAEIFEGNMDYKDIYRVCLKHDVKYAVVEQDTCLDDPFKSLEISYNNIKRNNLF